MGALVSLLIAIAVSLLVTRVAAIALAMTGLSRDSARFQARSAFTGVGFTTSEAEKVVSHPVRRRILMLLMLMGNAGVITVVSSLVLTFVGAAGPYARILRLVLIALGLGLIWLVSASRWLEKYMSRLIKWALNRWGRLDVRDYASLLHLSGEYQVMELKVDADDWLADKCLSELHLRQEGVLVLGIQRQNGKYVGAPKGKTRVCPGDVMILYGRLPILSELDTRRNDISGEFAHQDAVQQQRQVDLQQDVEDQESYSEENGRSG